MRIDWRLFPMKLHYFLRFMGTGPLTVFLPVITRQMGVPEKVLGDIWTVLPCVSMLAKTLAGGIADVTKGHRAVFLGGLFLMVTSLTALYWVPDMPIASNTSSSSNSSNKDILNFSSTLSPFFNTSTTGDLSTSLSSTLPRVSSLSSVTSSASLVDVQDTNASLPASEPDPKGGGGGGLELLQTYEFWVLFLCLLGQYCGHVTVITMQETVCFQLLGEARDKYGQQRLWGTVGIGLSAIVSGALVDVYSKGLGRKDYLPAHILTAFFLVLDIFLVARIQFPQPEKRMSSSALQGALWRPHVVLVLVTTGVVGMVGGLLWTFEFLLVEDVARQWDPLFPHIRLVLGLLMGVQCFLAEVPFFVLAGRIIKRLGHANALFVSLMGFMVRLILYSFVTNPWCFLPIDLLHGISFAVAYPCFISYASTVAPKGAEATTQAIFGAIFFGCTGVGGFVGGRLFEVVGGRQTFLLVGVATGVYSILFLMAHCIINRLTRSTAMVSRKVDVMVPALTVTAAEEKQEGEGVKEEAKEEENEDMKLDVVEIREQKKGNGRDSVRAVSYRKTMDFDV